MKKVRYLDRKLVRNILRHTETHNRLQEEDGMWQNRRQESSRRRTGGRPPPQRQRDRPRQMGGRYEILVIKPSKNKIPVDRPGVSKKRRIRAFLFNMSYFLQRQPPRIFILIGHQLFSLKSSLT